MKRPFTVAAVAGTAAHHSFELGSGVGLVWQPFMGLGGSLAYWSTSLPLLALAASRGGDRFAKPLAFATGTGLGGMAVHYSLWPFELRRGVPVLTEAEGLSPGQLPAYNAILWAWGAACLLALLFETPRRARKWFLFGVLNAVPFRASAKHHFTWATEQAQTNPAWWNRGLRP